MRPAPLRCRDRRCERIGNRSESGRKRRSSLCFSIRSRKDNPLVLRMIGDDAHSSGAGARNLHDRGGNRASHGFHRHRSSQGHRDIRAHHCFEQRCTVFDRFSRLHRRHKRHRTKTAKQDTCRAEDAEDSHCRNSVSVISFSDKRLNIQCMVGHCPELYTPANPPLSSWTSPHSRNSSSSAVVSATTPTNL